MPSNHRAQPPRLAESNATALKAFYCVQDILGFFDYCELTGPSGKLSVGSGAELRQLSLDTFEVRLQIFCTFSGLLSIPR